MKRRSFFTGILQSVAAIAVASSMEVFGGIQNIGATVAERHTIIRTLWSKCITPREDFHAPTIARAIKSETLTEAISDIPEGFKVVQNSGEWVDIEDPEVPESKGKWSFRVTTVAEPI